MFQGTVHRVRVGFSGNGLPYRILRILSILGNYDLFLLLFRSIDIFCLFCLFCFLHLSILIYLSYLIPFYPQQILVKSHEIQGPLLRFACERALFSQHFGSPRCPLGAPGHLGGVIMRNVRQF